MYNESRTGVCLFCLFFLSITMSAKFPSHMKLYQQVSLAPEVSILKLAPIVDCNKKRQVWYIKSLQVEPKSLGAFCEYHDKEVRKLASRGGIGVLVYDMSDVESVENWPVTCRQFVETTCGLIQPYENWLKEVIIVIKDESSYLLLNTIFCTLYSPTRPTTIVTSFDEAMKLLSEIWTDDSPGAVSD